MITRERHWLILRATQGAFHRRMTYEEIAAIECISACRRTLFKTFERENHHRKVAAEKPLLTQAHREARLRWAYKHQPDHTNCETSSCIGRAVHVGDRVRPWRMREDILHSSTIPPVLKNAWRDRQFESWRVAKWWSPDPIVSSQVGVVAASECQ